MPPPALRRPRFADVRIQVAAAGAVEAEPGSQLIEAVQELGWRGQTQPLQLRVDQIAQRGQLFLHPLLVTVFLPGQLVRELGFRYGVDVYPEQALISLR